MGTPNEKLAESLRVLKEKQGEAKTVFESKDFTRVHRERLVTAGYLREIMKGWYMLVNPQEREGDTTFWYANFFSFIAQYCEMRFGREWHLSPEASIAFYAQNPTVPKQVLVFTPEGNNKPLSLKHGTSLFVYKTSKKLEAGSVVRTDNGLRILSLPQALIQATPRLYTESPMEMQLVLNRLQDISELLSLLLQGQHSTIAGRLAGAFRALGRANDADRIVSTMGKAFFKVEESNPFEEVPRQPLIHAENPCSQRICLLWEKMRTAVVDVFPDSPGLPVDVESYMNDVQDRHIEDAYHSLSIEGYRVTEDLIEKIASGNWNPKDSDKDKNDRNALAAFGYYQAFEEVKAGVLSILQGHDCAEVLKKAHHDWYSALFSPSVQAGLLETKHLAGYRSCPVYIRNSRHAPPSFESIRQAMPTLFELIKQEPHAGVRAVLGHFIFVYLHPYADGNGRIGRFLMNSLLASGGYPWTIVRVEHRTEYMAALEQASVEGNIAPFALFIAKCLKRD
jgi:fido (protein-threonine AMPylation protein)